MKGNNRPFFRGLRGRLAGSFVLVIAVSLGVAALMVQLLALPRLDETVLLANRRRAYRLAPFLAQTYRQTGSWQGAEALVNTFADPLPSELAAGALSYFPQRAVLLDALGRDRLVLADGAGRVVADSTGQLAAGDPLPPELAAQSAVILVDGAVVGQAAVEAGLEQIAAAVVLTVLRRSLLGAGLLAAAAGLLVALGLAQRLAQPVHRLSRAAEALARGESNQPLLVETADEIGQLTESFNAMAEALSAQKRLRRQMVADIAHELRTPLSVMQLDLESMADGLQAPDEAARSLQAELDALNRLIEDLRLLSLADTGGLQFDLERLELASFLRRVAASWHNKMQTRQAHLLAEIPDWLPTIYADEGRLAQVFNNLLSNALRYTPAEQTVTLGARAGQGEVLVWVADNGPGMAAADLPHVFDRFYRADTSRSRDTGGSGLGLAIAKQWVTLHGGHIWAESEPGAGAQFYVSLPGIKD